MAATFMLIWIPEPDCGCESPAERRWWGAACQLTVTSAQPTQLTCSSSKPDFTCASQGILWLLFLLSWQALQEKHVERLREKITVPWSSHIVFVAQTDKPGSRLLQLFIVGVAFCALLHTLCLTLCYTHCASTYILCESCSLCKTW